MERERDEAQDNSRRKYSIPINHSVVVLRLCIYLNMAETFSAFIWTAGLCIYPVLSLRDAYKKGEVRNKEADAKVQVDGGSWAFDGPDHWECQDAEEQANKWKGEAHPTD